MLHMWLNADAAFMYSTEELKVQYVRILAKTKINRM